MFNSQGVYEQGKIGNGSLALPFRGKKVFRVYGGPYLGKPENMFGVKMAKEIRAAQVDVDIPTPDFKTPPPALLDAGLKATVETILKGHPVYVGCMAGRGRTGLFLAVLVKAFGVENPVEYVREHYYPHAVETEEQYAFVMRYKFTNELQGMIEHARLNSVWNPRHWFRKELTTKV